MIQRGVKKVKKTAFFFFPLQIYLWVRVTNTPIILVGITKKKYRISPLDIQQDRQGRLLGEEKVEMGE